MKGICFSHEARRTVSLDKYATVLCHLEVDQTVRPVIHPPRKVPVALRDRLKEELDKLVGEEILFPVTEPTKWMSSLVLVNKPNKLRICIDPQNLNKAL